MIKKVLFSFWICLAMAQASPAQNPNVDPVVKDVLTVAASARMNGFIADKLKASFHNRILAQDVDRLVAPFRNRTETSCWQSEFWGKWFTSAALAYRYMPDPELKEHMTKAVTGLTATQTADGYIGNYAADKHLASWDIWGRKYSMLGLLAWFDLTHDRVALEAAEKVALHLMAELHERQLMIVKTGNHRGMAASSVLEPVCQLYSRTGEKKYLDFALEIVRQWETPEGPQLISRAGTDVSARFPKPTSWYGPEQGQKAYEMMSCYEGLLELYRLTGKEEFKHAVIRTWENIRETEINIAGSGSAVECWFGGARRQTMPVYHYQETCVTTTWIKLNQQLLRLTGEAKYADAIEQTYCNALLGSMRPDGSDWAKYTPLSGQRLEGSEQCGMGLNCCNASGPRALFTLPLTAVMQEKSGVSVNFFIDGTYVLETPQRRTVELIQKTDFPITGKVVMEVRPEKPEQMSIRIRIPGWSRKSEIEINGIRLKNLHPGEYFSIERLWKPGDILSLSLDMTASVIKMGNQPENVAITRGPVVLSRDSRLPGPAMEAILAPVIEKDGTVILKQVKDNDPDFWMKFEVACIPESYKESGAQPVSVVFCDYASAGNARQGFPFFRVWLPQPFDPRKM